MCDLPVSYLASFKYAIYMLILKSMQFTPYAFSPSESELKQPTAASLFVSHYSLFLSIFINISITKKSGSHSSALTFPVINFANLLSNICRSPTSKANGPDRLLSSFEITCDQLDLALFVNYLTISLSPPLQIASHSYHQVHWYVFWAASALAFLDFHPLALALFVNFCIPRLSPHL
ncbi:hypothetical protein CTAM01_08020 [Colletotrichum tamarilloi]|uniref:Uncharacterized protein n=1 Tax=Colletotrichum tamarilloi TaxID=1209934 RepID=A0ABQ9R750_9PEZI|nr:uncharacterized protein CTAM01_08020 [Colletotrichum tamarilloi]KAK1497008.1 hypothetical protein CTAM01_08020 [Colletotrichum tamarilloi]